MEQSKITLANTTVGTELKPNSIYLIDFSKLESVNDLITILAASGIGFPSDHPHINLVKPFLNLEQPMPILKEPIEKKVNLPKLKQL